MLIFFMNPHGFYLYHDAQADRAELYECLRDVDLWCLAKLGRVPPRIDAGEPAPSDYWKYPRGVGRPCNVAVGGWGAGLHAFGRNLPQN